MAGILNKVEDHLNEKNVAYIKEENSVSFIGSIGDNDDYEIEFVSYEDDHQISLFLDYKETILENKKPIVAEYIVRINSRLPIGALRMNFNAGHVYYKMSNILVGQLLTNKIIEKMVGGALFSMDFSSPGFTAICNEGKSALEAFTIVESALYE